MWHDNIIGSIGNTPLVKLNRLATDIDCTVLAKLELFNPGGSVKDRIGISMIRAAEREGKLEKGGTIIECTSGNTGAGLAVAAIALGYNCIFTTTDKQSQEKIDVLRALGAVVHVCPTHVAPEDPRSYYSVAARLAEEIPNSYHMNQYDNPANTVAHYETTGPELWEQTEERITHFFAGAGTGGTISGTAKYLKEKNNEIKIIGIDPYGSVYYKYFHEGVFDHAEIYPYLTEGVGEDILAGNMEFGIVDDYVRVTDKASMQFTRRLAREEGMFVGQSCGMAVAGALQWMRDNRASLNTDDVAVILLPDSGFRYLSKTYNDNWMRGHGFLEREVPLSAAGVIAARGGGPRIVSMTTTDTVGEAIETMAEYGISQLPIMDDSQQVGSITESLLLNKLIGDPSSRTQSVGEIMQAPLPVVTPDIGIQQLAAFLERESGAVLVSSDEGLQILTKTDLIAALSGVAS